MEMRRVWIATVVKMVKTKTIRKPSNKVNSLVKARLIVSGINLFFVEACSMDSLVEACSMDLLVEACSMDPLVEARSMDGPMMYFKTIEKR